MKSSTLWRPLAALAVGLWLTGAARAQQPFIYPSKGQSPQQEETDRGQCYSWAVQQSHFDPLNPPAPTAPPPQAQAQSGGMGRSLFGGALLGAGIGALAGPHASEGAAIGGIFGAMRYRRREQEEQQQQMQQQLAYQQQQGAILAQGKANYERAFKACMVGRGYTVE
jgi:hypothetical protein